MASQISLFNKPTDQMKFLPPSVHGYWPKTVGFGLQFVELVTMPPRPSAPVLPYHPAVILLRIIEYLKHHDTLYSNIKHEIKKYKTDKVWVESKWKL